MKNSKKWGAIASLVFAAVILAKLQPAHAQWQEIGAVSKDLPAQDLGNCDYRLSFTYTPDSAPAEVRKLYLQPIAAEDLPQYQGGRMQELKFFADYPTIETVRGGGGMAVPLSWDELQRIFVDQRPSSPHVLLRLPTDVTNRDITFRFNSAESTPEGELSEAALDLEEDAFVLEKKCARPAAAPAAIPVVSASASSQLSTYYGPDKTFDNNLNSYWISAVSGTVHTLTYDLGKAHRLDALAIDWYSDYYASANFSVEISKDGVSFAPLQSGLNKPQRINLNEATARYVRLVMPRSATASYIIIKEVRFSGWQP